MIKTRKIQLTGKSTYIVSLPKSWANKNHVERGMEVYIEDMSDGTLKICTEKTGRKKQEIAINIDSMGPVEMERKIMTFYLNGFGTISIVSKKLIPPEHRKTILAQISRMMGFEIVEEKPERMVMQDFFSHANLSLPKTLKRSHMIACNIQTTFWNAIKLGDIKSLENVLDMENEVDRLTFLIQRQLRGFMGNSSSTENMEITASEISAYYVACRRVERIADNISKSAEEMLLLPDSMPIEGVMPVLSEANDFSFNMHSKSMKAFFEKEKSDMNSLIDSNKAFQNQKINHLKKLFSIKGIKPTNYILLTRYHEIANLGEDICEIVLNFPD